MWLQFVTVSELLGNLSLVDDPGLDGNQHDRPAPSCHPHTVGGAWKEVIGRLQYGFTSDERSAQNFKKLSNFLSELLRLA